MHFSPIVISVLVATVSLANAQPTVPNNPNLIDVQTLDPTIAVNLVYSTPNNFMGADVYGELDRCYLNPDTATMLAKASQILSERSKLHFVVYDCVRPLAVQRKMWSLVAGTSKQQYVANPEKKGKGMHNYGCAVDLTIADAKGQVVDMGSPYDHFGKAAQPRLEHRRFEQGKLHGEQWANRLLLREVMVRAGFVPLANEWWHFSCAPSDIAHTRYPVIP